VTRENQEPGTGANSVSVAPRTILKRPEAAKWEMMQLLKKWGEGTLTEEEKVVVATVTAKLSDNENGESTRGGEAREAALAALKKWWNEG
jgi:hypothetical protein